MKKLNDVLYNFDLDEHSSSVYECMEFISKLSSDRLKFGITCMIFDIDSISKDRKLTYKEYVGLEMLINYIQWAEEDKV